MRKIIQFSVLLLTANLMVTVVSAQLPKVLAFANATYVNPGGEIKNNSNYGWGYEAGGGVGFGKTILFASVGQLNYHLEQEVINGMVLFSGGNVKVTPVKVGIRRYLIAGLFVNGDIGLAINDSQSKFLYEGGAGFKLGFFEIGASYMGYKIGNLSMNSLLFKAGLSIKL